jgi:uncharacterized protein
MQGVVNQRCEATLALVVGISRFGQLLIVAHTDRGETIRMISARKATRPERRFYEQGN